MSGVRKGNSNKTSGEKKTSIEKKEEKASAKDLDLVLSEAVGRECKTGTIKKLLEPLKVFVDKKNMPPGATPGLPPIDMNELAKLLRNPNMPSHKLMKEVADKILGETLDNTGENDIPGVKGLFDCILEVSLLHEESEDEEDEGDHEPIVRRIPCRICNKVFGSNMTMKTHLLVAHPREEPTVLHAQHTSTDAEQQEKPDPSRRKRSKSVRLSESESGVKRPRHPSKSDDPKAKSLGEENIPVTRRSSLSRSQVKAISGLSHLQSGEDCEHSKVDSGITGTQSKINEPQESANVMTPSVSTTPELSQLVQSSQRIPEKKGDEEEQNLSVDVASVSECDLDGPSAKKQRLDERSQKDISNSSSEDLHSQASSNVIKSSSAKSENDSQEKSPGKARARKSSRRM